MTDHKPLMFILNPKSSLPPISAAHIQRWAVFLSAYDYSIEYKNTKAHANADSLSRLPIEGDKEDTIDSMFKVFLVDGLPLTAADIAGETVKDPILSQVYQYVLGGWPQKGVSDALKPFYQQRDQLSTDQGCLLWGTRVVIPDSLRSRLLKELHCTHPGIVKMKLLARSYMWWPGLDLHVERIVKNCQECALQ